ncbi:SAM-dependent methyltransferase [Nonomuraea sp. NBC_01738]|uniref:SAM-dependent methyltransferase n=1 Tax=Nonomuraea sp. NBC_01738 TaxID=2976003 RepID=UPI002E0EE7B5|nr:SAM-dependent methyltransferase [Nonomuraea sp. NBC_01738]
MAEVDDAAPYGLNLAEASPARVYDYLLGGKDNFDVDRAEGERIRALMPGVEHGVRAQRDVLGRAVRFLVGEAGIRQLVDIGTGLPTAENVHQVAHALDPEVRVAYVDNDPHVLVHARALLARNANTLAVRGDLREPAALLADRELAAHIDLSAPVGLILCGILHHIQDEDDPWRLTKELVAALPSGSYVFIHHLLNRGDEQSRSLSEARNTVYRTKDEISRFFAGLEMVTPGLVGVPDWRPDPDQVVHDDQPVLKLAMAGVGRKP